jgi:hypothetical protein
MTVHRCQVIALDGCRFNPNVQILIAVKLMDVIVTPFAQSTRDTGFHNEKPGHSGQQSAYFRPDLRSL